MNTEQKHHIVDQLRIYIDRIGSAQKAANSMKKVSSATISQMLNGKWDLIKDEMWRNVSTQIGVKSEKWQLVETRDFKFMNRILNDVRQNSLVVAVTGQAGTGKTACVKHFSAENKDVFTLQCNEYWNRKTFLQELLALMGVEYSGYTVSEMMQEVVRRLKVKEHPVIVMDEADKLSDPVLYFFITLYNQLEDHCGILLCATNFLDKRIRRGVKLNKKGYSEIYSRIGRKCVELKGIGYNDIGAICQANGISDPNIIKEVVQDSEGDLRRVKRKIYALKHL